MTCSSDQVLVQYDCIRGAVPNELPCGAALAAAPGAGGARLLGLGTPHPPGRLAQRRCGSRRIHRPQPAAGEYNTIPSERASQEEQNGENFSSVAPSSEELLVRKEFDQNALL